MSPEQAKARLKALEAYEMYQLKNDWDCPDRVGDELVKILAAKARLRAIIDAAGK